MTFLGSSVPQSKYRPSNPLIASHKPQPEAPLADQISQATPSNCIDRRRMQALQGFAGDDHDMEDEDRPFKSPDQSRGIRIGRALPSQRSSSARANNSNGSHNFAHFSDALDGFELPQRPRQFKTEPVEFDLESPPPTSLASRSKRKRDTNDDQQPRHERSSQKDPEAPRHDTHIGRQPKRSEPGLTEVVDLTKDAAELQLRTTSIHPIPPQSSIKGMLPQPLTDGQSTLMAHIDVPHNTLQQARQIYDGEGIVLPHSIKKWQQLRDFVLQHLRPSSQFTPRLCAAAQAHAFWNATGEIAKQIRQLALDFGRTTELAGTALEISPAPMHLPTRPTNDDVKAKKIKTEHDSPPINNGTPQRILHTPQGNLQSLDQVIHNPVPNRLCPPNATLSTSRKSPNSLSPEELHAELKPSTVLASLLPPDAPEGCPRLRELWKPSLLRLPLSSHDHLTLQDTVVSILYRYDDKTNTAIEAFFDDKTSPHFFFLFKARDIKLHSWSIEREDDIITIGIEKQRPLNIALSEALRPSAGQYDLTIRFRMAPLNEPTPATEAVGREDHNIQDPTPLAHRQWLLIDTSIFPSSPNLTTFLYETPPTRGADDHETYKHPAQTPYLPASHLSIFAHYLQQTAFCTSAMNGEFQLAYGRRVRYDALLGRARVVWDYALKGAKTQKEKRERGEYNRSAGGGKGKASTGGLGEEGNGVPGSGVARKYLAGVRGVPSEVTGAETADGELEDDIENREIVVGRRRKSVGAKRTKANRAERRGNSYAGESDAESGIE